MKPMKLAFIVANGNLAIGLFFAFTGQPVLLWLAIITAYLAMILGFLAEASK